MTPTQCTRTFEGRISIARRFSADLLSAPADGRLRPLIDRVIPLDQALEAQIYLATNTHTQTGQII